MTVDIVFELVKDFGLPVVLVIFFVIQGSKRETQTNERLDAMTAFQQETLVTLVVEQKETLAAFASVIARSNEVHDRCLALVEAQLPKS